MSGALQLLPEPALRSAGSAHESPRQPSAAAGIAWAAALAIGLLFSLHTRDFGADGSSIPWLASALALLALAPALRRGLQPTRRHGVPLLAVVGAIHALYFAAPVLVADRVAFMALEPPNPALVKALLLTLLGLTTLYVGYGVLAPALVSLAPARMHLSNDQARQLALLCLPVGLAASAMLRLGLGLGSLTQPVRLVAQLLPIALGLGVLLSRRRALSRPLVVVLFAVLWPLYLMLEMSEGQIGFALRSGVFVLALLWASGMRVPLLPLMLAGALALVMRGGAAEFRSMSKFDAHLMSSSPLDRAAMFVDVARAEFEADGGRRTVETALDRVSQVALFAHAVERTPEVVPFWNGATLATLPQSFVPRALWPTKPSKNLGQRFGHRYGVLHADDSTTSVNLPQIVELYINFGVLGVALGLALVGMLYRVVVSRWLHEDAGLGGILLGATAFRELVNVESDFSMVIGNLGQSFLVLWIVLRVYIRLTGAGAGPKAPLLPMRGPVGGGLQGAEG